MPQAYLSLDQRWMPQVHFVLHADTDAAERAPVVRAALRELDPGGMDARLCPGDRDPVPDEEGRMEGFRIDLVRVSCEAATK